VNHLEAMSQWAHLGRAKAPFHLYVPAGSVDIARRLAAENQVNVAEIWSFHTIGDQTRFTLVHRAPGAPAAEPKRPAAAGAVAPAKRPRAATPRRATPARRATAARPRAKSAAAKKSPARAQKRK
jgi:hypothetical protein